MNKKSFLFFTIAGALGAIFIVNYFLGMTYDRSGSYDIITGAFVEVFILTAFFEYANAKDRQEESKKMQAQLKQIRSAIRKEHSRLIYILQAKQINSNSRQQAQQQQSADIAAPVQQQSKKNPDQRGEI